MKRRTLLGTTVGVVTGLSGCIGNASISDLRAPHVSVSAADPGHKFTFTAEVERQLGWLSPAEITLALRNDADVARGVEFGYTVPFDTQGGRHTERDIPLFLAPEFHRTEKELHVKPDQPGCWQAPPRSVTTPDSVTFSVLTPGEVVSQTYQVLASEESECLAAGEYHFNDTIRIAVDEQGNPVTELSDGANVHVDFELSVLLKDE